MDVFLLKPGTIEPARVLGAVALVALSVVWWLLTLPKCATAATNKPMYPVVGESKRSKLLWPIHGIRNQLNWLLNGPQIIHDAYKQVCCCFAARAEV